MNNLILSSGHAITQVISNFERLYRESRGRARDNGNSRSTRSQAQEESFFDFMVTFRGRGDVEDRPDNPNMNLTERRWFRLMSLEDYDIEKPIAEREIVEPAWFENPLFRTKILTDNQKLAMFAWNEWSLTLEIDSNNIIFIETALEMLLVPLEKQGHLLQVETLVEPLRQISKLFPEEYPTKIHNGFRILRGNCEQPVLLFLCYSEVLRTGSFCVVENIKNWLRMRTRRPMRENLSLLADIVSQIPIEISDMHRKTCHEIIKAIKRLIFVQYLAPGTEIDNVECKMTHCWRDISIGRFLEFNYQIQKKGGGASFARDTPSINDIKQRVRDLDDIKIEVETRTLYDWHKHLRYSQILNEEGDNFSQDEVFTHSLAKTVQAQEGMLDQVIDEFSHLNTLEDIPGQRVPNDDPENNENNDNNRPGNADSAISTASDMTEYTINGSEDDAEELPSVEDLMHPE